MDVREKLVELMLKEDDVCEPNECKNCGANGSCYYHRAANRIIAHGVTVQEWISVKDRLPEPFVSVLVQMPGEEPFPTVREGFISNDGIWQCAMFRREPGDVTHWQPMPQPPKGE